MLLNLALKLQDNEEEGERVSLELGSQMERIFVQKNQHISKVMISFYTYKWVLNSSIALMKV